MKKAYWLISIIAVATTMTACGEAKNQADGGVASPAIAPAPAKEIPFIAPADRPMPKPRRSEPTSY